MESSDTGFKHAAAPERDAVLLCKVVDLYGLCNTADPADFNVDDLTAAELYGTSRCFIGIDAFIQTYRCLELLLQFGMIDQVSCSKRLFNHHQVKFIQLL